MKIFFTVTFIIYFEHAQTIDQYQLDWNFTVINLLLKLI